MTVLVDAARVTDCFHMAISRSSPSGGGADTGLFVLLFDSKKNQGSKNQKTKENDENNSPILWQKKIKEITLNYTITSLEGKNSIMEFFIRNKLLVNH